MIQYTHYMGMKKSRVRINASWDHEQCITYHHHLPTDKYPPVEEVGQHAERHINYQNHSNKSKPTPPQKQKWIIHWGTIGQH